MTTDVVPFQKRGVQLYRAQAEFRFGANGNFFTVPLTFAPVFGTNDEARAFVDRYPPQSIQQIYYDPSNPNSVMLTSRGWNRKFLFPLLLIAAGLASLITSATYFLRSARCLCPRCATSVELYDRFCFSCAYRLPKQKRKVVKNL
jgi:hypothetical protein